MKSKTQLVLAVLIAAKIMIGLTFFFQLEIGAIFGGSAANASENRQKMPETPPADATARSEGQVDLEFIVQKMELLKRKEQEIERKKTELKVFQEEIDRKIAKLSRIRNEIKAQVDRKETIEKQKVKHLIKVYAAMKPQSAAGLIEKQDQSFAIELLSQMKGEAVGQILTYVQKEKAAKLIEGLAKRK